MKEIKKILEDFDGRHTGELNTILETLERSQKQLLALLKLAQSSKEPSVEIGATWLIKNLMEQGTRLDEKASFKLAEALPLMKDKDSVLHLLQAIPFISFTEEIDQLLLESCDDILREQDYKFARAWAFNCLGLVAQHQKKYQSKILKRLNHALEEEPASVKARIRNVLKKMP